MKKTLIALAVLSALADAASAQSSVTLYGTVDVSGRYVKNDGQSRRFSEATDGLNSSQLGFRGVEDLGDGLKAGFTLLSGVNADAGTANAKFFNRRSTVSLFSKLGEIRLGRDYTPSWVTQGTFDAFGFVGLGSATSTRQLYNGTRQDNTIGYFLPSGLGGWFGQAMVGASEGGSTADRPARYLGGRIGYDAGPITVAVAASSERFATNFSFSTVASGVGGTNVTALAGSTQTTFNIGATWDLGVLKLMGYYDHEKLQTARENFGSLSAVIPFGQSEVHAGYDRSKRSISGTPSTTIDQIKATYVYNLSKRTAVYATASRLDNKNNSTVSLSGGNGITRLSGTSKGAEFGLRHFF